MNTGGFTPLLPSPESLSIAEQVAQMIVVRVSGHLFDHQRGYPNWEADQSTLDHYLNLGIGGVILLGGSAAEVGIRTHTLQSQTSVPLLIAADIEEGVGQRFDGATQFPPPMALEAIYHQAPEKAIAYAEAMGAVTAQEALAVGINWLLAPVVDVNNNPRNPVINVRAFGRSPAVVSQLAAAFIRGSQRHAVLTTAKHFPGHGDTHIDSHLTLPTIPHDLKRLEAIELAPFRAAIAAGVDAIMTAHLRVPALDRQHPATLSGAILNPILRQKLGFDGVIVTDALIMGGITQHYGDYEAAVMAVEAGADVLLMPRDPEGVIGAICEAVTIGRLAPERILDAVERLWRAKQKAMALMEIPPESCHAWEHVQPPPVRLETLAQPEDRVQARAILQAAMVVQGQIPPNANGRAENIVLMDDLLSSPGLTNRSAAIAVPRQLGYRLRLIDHNGCQQLPIAAPAPALLQLFIRGNPFRGSAEITDMAQTWLRALIKNEGLIGIVVYGSPYAFASFEADLPEGIARGFTYGQTPLAQELLMQALCDYEVGLNSSSTFTD